LLTPFKTQPLKHLLDKSVPASGENAEPHYLTAPQVADLLQVDEKTVLRWSLQDVSMPVLRRGRVIRFPRERLLTWLERQEPRSARRSAQGSTNGPPPSAYAREATRPTRRPRNCPERLDDAGYTAGA
jgi:excisionase family DNA binding protein